MRGRSHRQAILIVAPADVRVIREHRASHVVDVKAGPPFPVYRGWRTSRQRPRRRRRPWPRRRTQRPRRYYDTATDLEQVLQRLFLPIVYPTNGIIQPALQDVGVGGGTPPVCATVAANRGTLLHRRSDCGLPITPRRGQSGVRIAHGEQMLGPKT